MLNGPSVHDNATLPIRKYIIRDVGYPIREWLITPYASAIGMREIFYYLLSSTRICVERAFRRLKDFWRLFAKPISHPKIERLGETVYAGCILHNVLIDRGDTIDQRIYRDMPLRPPAYTTIPVLSGSGEERA
jgi:hypothetical protein